MTATDTTTQVVSDSGNDVGPGQRLREAREAANLTLAEVASRMRLLPQVLESLENDHYEQLHGATFVRGYLSGYARLLDLPERPILEAYERHGYGPPALVSEVGRKPEVHVSDFSVRMVTYVIAGLLVVLVVLWWQSRQPSIGTPVGAQLSAESEPQATDGSANDGESVDAPAPSSDSPATTESVAGTPPMGETVEPAQAASESAGESDAQQPQPAASNEQTIGNDAAYVEVPPGEDTRARDARTETQTSSQSGDTAIANEMTSATNSETASDAVSATPGEADGATEPVAAAPDSVESDGTDDSAEIEEQTPRPAPLPGSDRLAIQLARESWVEIYDRGGGRLYYSLAREGSQVVVQGAGPMRVLLGDVEGAVVAYNGEPFDLSRYQGRSVVRFTIGELSSTTAPEPPVPAGAQEPLTRETRQPTATEFQHAVARVDTVRTTPAEATESAPDAGRPDYSSRATE